MFRRGSCLVEVHARAGWTVHVFIFTDELTDLLGLPGGGSRDTSASSINPHSSGKMNTSLTSTSLGIGGLGSGLPFPKVSGDIGMKTSQLTASNFPARKSAFQITSNHAIKEHENRGE